MFDIFKKRKQQQVSVLNNGVLSEDDTRKNVVLNSLSKQKSKIRTYQIFLFVITSFIVIVTGIIVYLMLAIAPKSNWGINGLVLLWLLLFLMLFAINCLIKRICRDTKAKRKIEFLETRLKMDSDKDLIIAYRLDRELRMIYRILES